MRLITRAISVALLALCAACATAPPVTVPADVRNAPQSELESVFGQLENQLAGTREGTERAAALESDLRQVGDELAEREAARIRTQLSQVPRVEDKLPLAAVDAATQRLDDIRRWSPPVYASLKQDLAQERKATSEDIAEHRRRLDSLGRDEPGTRIRLLAELAALHGEGSARHDELVAEREALIGEVAQNADEAFAEEDYERAADLLGIVEQVQPGDAAVARRKCEANGRAVVKRISTSLETGRVDRSMKLLAEFAETDCLIQIRDELAPSASSLSAALAALADEAVDRGDLRTAYERYSDAQTIRELLLERPLAVSASASDRFLTQLDSAYQWAFSNEQYGLALGYLGVMREFGPETPMLRRRIRMTEDEVARRAVRGLTVYPFEDPPAAAQKVGDAVGSKVLQFIFRTIPADVRIVEREQLERILEECERSGSCSELATADFIIQGTILDSKVETNERQATETKRVVTGQEDIPNPAHAEWMALDRREREQTPEPPPTITRDVQEDIRTTVTIVRKVGIISASYRVVDASSGSVLFTNSVQTRREFEDVGRPGVQRGVYKQDVDFIELPPDTEIFSGVDGLADQISERIGEELVGFLRDPEKRYTRDAQRFADEGDYGSAARHCAYAIALLEAKRRDAALLRQDLKHYAMSARLPAGILPAREPVPASETTASLR